MVRAYNTEFGFKTLENVSKTSGKPPWTNNHNKTKTNYHEHILWNNLYI